MIAAEEVVETKENMALLNKVVLFLDKTPSPFYDNVFDGKMAWVLFFCIYAEAMQKPEYDEKASKLFYRIEINLHNNLVINFKNGICGIGWGIMFLNTNGFIDDVEDLLQKIDRMVMERDLRRITDYSFDIGLGGILAYVSQRLILYRAGGKPQFDIQYMHDLWLKCDNLLKSEEKDARCRSFALQLLDADTDESTETLPLKIESVFALPTIINNNEILWEASMQSCIGFGLKALTEVVKLKRVLPAK